VSQFTFARRGACYPPGAGDFRGPVIGAAGTRNFEPDDVVFCELAWPPRPRYRYRRLRGDWPRAGLRPTTAIVPPGRKQQVARYRACAHHRAWRHRGRSEASTSGEFFGYRAAFSNSSARQSRQSPRKTLPQAHRPKLKLASRNIGNRSGNEAVHDGCRENTAAAHFEQSSSDSRPGWRSHFGEPTKPFFGIAKAS
jgi:hypothetical protein